MDFDNNLSPVEPKSKWAVFQIFYLVCCYVEHWNQMANCLVTYGFNEDTERIEHLTWICDQLCTVFSKNIIGNVTAKNYLKESLSSILCFIIQGKGSSWKRFDPEILFVVMLVILRILTRLSFLSSRSQWNRKRFSPLRANMLFVSIHFSLEKDSVVFSAFVNYNIMLCIEFSSLRLKCDMGEFF